MFDSPAVTDVRPAHWPTGAGEAPPVGDGLPTAQDRTSPAQGLQRLLREVPSGEGAGSGERELVASEDSVTAGGVRDAYDMRLYREPDGKYTVELDMKIEFDFTTGPDGQTWTPETRQQFIDDYKQVVEGAWSGHTITGEDGQQVTLDVNLDVSEQDDVADNQNWSAQIIKIDEGGFSQSYVIPSQNTGVFDSEDVKPVEKGASDPQVGAAHEFGHMIGLPDEYNGSAGPEAAKDTDSIMHTGMDVRGRHMDIIEAWINAQD